MTRAQAFQYKILVITLLAAASCALGYRLFQRDLRSKYTYDKIALLTRFTAKEYCSCRFVVGQSEDYCRAYVNAEIPILGVRVRSSWITRVETVNGPGMPEYEAAAVAHGLFFAKAESRYYGQAGCRLLP